VPTSVIFLCCTETRSDVGAILQIRSETVSTSLLVLPPLMLVYLQTSAGKLETYFTSIDRRGFENCLLSVHLKHLKHRGTNMYHQI
jgi:hypothetical protein